MLKLRILNRSVYTWISCFSVATIILIYSTSAFVMPTQVYPTTEDRRQFHDELRESARNGLPINYWSFHDWVGGDVGLQIKISGVDPDSSSSKVFRPLFAGDELFIRDPAHFFPDSDRIRITVTADPASAAENIEAEIFRSVGTSAGYVAAEDGQGVILDLESMSSTSSLSILFKPRF